MNNQMPLATADQREICNNRFVAAKHETKSAPRAADFPGKPRKSRGLALALGFMLAVFFLTGCGSVTAYHGDVKRTGWQRHEPLLSAANVNSAHFGLIAQITLDERVDAQPLVVPLAGQNVVYVATEANTVYAIDADTGIILEKCQSRNAGSESKELSLQREPRGHQQHAGD